MAKAPDHPWEMTYEFWARVRPLVPVPRRNLSKPYQRQAGAGHPPKSARLVVQGNCVRAAHGVPVILNDLLPAV